MTGFIPEHELSRKSFLKGAGGLVVGFSTMGALLAPGKASGANGDRLSPANPYASVVRDLSQVDSYVVIHPDNTASILIGGSEHGQGSATGWLMLAAEELDMDMSQVKFVYADTAITPHPQQGTYSSAGTKHIGSQVRTAAAYAKQELLRLASISLGVPAASLTVKSGVVSGGGKTVSYGQLLGDKLFNATMATKAIYTGSFGTDDRFTPDGQLIPPSPAVFGPHNMQGEWPTKQVSEYKLVGTHVPRIDIPDIATGKLVYAGAVRVPGMVHGRIVLPRGQGAYTSAATVVSVDESSIRHIPDAQIVRKGNFIGVVAPNEWDAIQAAAQLKVTWADPPALPSSGNLWKQWRADNAAGAGAPDADGSIAGQYTGKYGPVGNVDAALQSAAKVVSQSYTYAFQIHAPIGPQVAIADVKPDGALILTFRTDPSGQVSSLASTLGLPASKIRVKFFPGSSVYGGGTGNNPGPMAAIMSQIVGKPVRLQLMRWDEHGWDTFGPALMADMRGGIDANGNIVAWEYTTFMLPLARADLTDELIGNVKYPPNAGRNGQETSANGVQYELPNWRVILKTPPLYGRYFKTGNMRASGSSQTAFPAETFADELAYAAKMDPIAFRRQNVRKTDLPASYIPGNGQKSFPQTGAPWTFNERFLGILDALEKASNWKPRVAASNLSDANVVTGRGVAFGPRAEPPTFGGVVAEIQVNKKTGKIRVKHIWAAQDQGLTVNPAGVENQILGQITMNVSRALYEEVRFDTKRVTSLDWVSYPILRFKDAPAITPIIVNRPDIQMAGAGDHVMEHVPAAIANAFFDATGVRIRQVPMTPAAVRGALATAGHGTAGVA